MILVVSLSEVNHSILHFKNVEHQQKVLLIASSTFYNPAIGFQVSLSIQPYPLLRHYFLSLSMITRSFRPFLFSLDELRPSFSLWNSQSTICTVQEVEQIHKESYLYTYNCLLLRRISYFQYAPYYISIHAVFHVTLKKRLRFIGPGSGPIFEMLFMAVLGAVTSSNKDAQYRILYIYSICLFLKANCQYQYTVDAQICFHLTAGNFLL